MMKKRVLSMLLAFVMVIGLLPDTTVTAGTADTHHTSHTGYTRWGSTNSLPASAGSYYLGNNVTLTAPWEPPNGVTLCLNGKSITISISYKNAISIPSGRTLTIADCTNQGKITGNGNQAINNSGTFTLYGGNITGTTTLRSGAGVYNSNGTFNMYGGSITGNSGDSGGGVYIYSGPFNMYGGSISGNTGKSGGGVHICEGTFNMYGGSITDNISTVKGSGVYIGESSTFNLYGGTIYGNDSTNVYLTEDTVIDIETLPSDTQIGITMATPGVFTNGGADYSNHFMSDNSAYEVKADGCSLTLCKIVISHTVTSTSGPGYTITPADDSDPSVKDGGSYSFTVTISEGYVKSDAFAVRANQSLLTADADGKYTISNIQADQTITVAGVVLHEHSWNYVSEDTNSDHVNDTLTASCTASGCTNPNGGSVTISVPDGNVYTGSPIEATISNSLTNGDTVNVVYEAASGSNLTNGKPVNAGSYTAKITLGSGANIQTVSIPYQIQPRTITADMVTLSSDTFVYDGTLHNVTIAVNYDAATRLTEGTDYSISGTLSATKASTGNGYAVLVQGEGNYKTQSPITKYWEIAKGTQTGISAQSVRTAYDGQSHGITITGLTDTMTVYYGTSKETCNSTTPITYTDVGDSRTIWFRAVSENFEDYYGSATVTIHPATITVTPDRNQSKIYGTADPLLTYCYSGNVPSEVPAFSGTLSRTPGQDVGTYALTLGTLALADNGTFKASNYELKLSDTPTSFTITQATPTITIAQNQWVVYDSKAVSAGTTAADVIYAYSGSGPVTVRWYTDVNGTPGSEISAPNTVGTYWIGVSAAEDTNYAAVAEVTQPFRITKRKLSISANPQEITYGSQIASTIDQVTAISLAEGDVLTDITLTANALTVGAGTTITPSTAIIKNSGTDVTHCYDIAYQEGSLTIQKAPQQSPPAAPTIKNSATTSSRIELNAQATPEDAFGDVEYACSTTASPPAEAAWQFSTVFDGLCKNTIYYFFARYAGDNNHQLSPISPAASIATLDTYTVSYDLNAGYGTVPIPQTQDVGTPFTAAAQGDIVKSGHKFLGWATTVGAATADYAADASISGISANVTLYAVWKANQYTISLDTDGGSAVAAIKQDYNTAVTAPENPTKTGYDFAGWMTEVGTDFVFIDGYTMPAESFTLTAKWTPRGDTAYTVNHYFQNIENDAYAAPEVQTASGTTGTQTTAMAKPIPGFTAQSFCQKVIAGDGTTVVDIYYTRNSHALTFQPVNGQADIVSTAKYGAPVTVPAAPTKTGYTFAGWDTAIPATMPAEDVTIKATWTINKYTITFDTDGGSEIASITQNYSTAITPPADPTKTGFTFAGWDTAIPATMPAENVTIKALWEEVVRSEDETRPVADYSDVDSSGWYYAGVHFCLEEGLMIGYPEGNFQPNTVASRAMLITMLWRMEGEPTSGQELNFTDAKDAWYTPALKWAVENKIIQGYGDGTVRPNDAMSREEMVTILYRYAAKKEYDVSTSGDIGNFTDAGQVSDYAKSTMQWAVGSGIIKGTTNTTLDPENDSTRAQLATLMMRFITKFEN